MFAAGQSFPALQSLEILGNLERPWRSSRPSKRTPTWTRRAGHGTIKYQSDLLNISRPQWPAPFSFFPSVHFGFWLRDGKFRKAVRFPLFSQAFEPRFSVGLGHTGPVRFVCVVFNVNSRSTLSWPCTKLAQLLPHVFHPWRSDDTDGSVRTISLSVGHYLRWDFIGAL